MTCPHLKENRCELAEQLAFQKLSLDVPCGPRLATCVKCLSQGAATAEKPTEAVVELVALSVPKPFAAKWKAVATVGDFSPPPPKPASPEKSRGLGDTVAKLTKAVGIQPCGGCQKRREWLNKVVPYSDK